MFIDIILIIILAYGIINSGSGATVLDDYRFWSRIFYSCQIRLPGNHQMVEDRKAYIDNSLKAACEANEQLANVKAEGEKILAQAHEEQARILAEAAATRDRIIKDAQNRAISEGDRLMIEIKKQIETEKESAIRDIRRQVAVLSVGIAEKIMRNKLADAKEQEELIDRMLDEMIESSKK